MQLANYLELLKRANVQRRQSALSALKAGMTEIKNGGSYHGCSSVEQLDKLLYVIKEYNISDLVINPTLSALEQLAIYDSLGYKRNYDIDKFEKKLKTMKKNADELARFSDEDIVLKLPRHPSRIYSYIRKEYEYIGLSEENITVMFTGVFELGKLARLAGDYEEYSIKSDAYLWGVVHSQLSEQTNLSNNKYQKLRQNTYVASKPKD